MDNHSVVIYVRVWGGLSFWDRICDGVVVDYQSVVIYI